MTDLLPSLAPDAPLVPAAASDDEDAFVPHASSRLSWAGLAAPAPAPLPASRGAAPAVGGGGKPVQASWSFRDAIALIDATQAPRSSLSSSLLEKITAVKGRRAAGAAGPIIADGEEGGGEEEEEADGHADGAQADAAPPATRGVKRSRPSGEDELASILRIGSAQPNPHRSKGGAGDTSGAVLTVPGGSGGGQALASEYSRFFEPDPFAAAAAGGGGAKKGSGGGGSDIVKAFQRGGAAASAPPLGKKAAQKHAKLLASTAAAAAASADTATTPAALVPQPAIGAALAEPQSFAEMNLSRALLKAVGALGYTAPTPIQRRTIPLALAGHDICGSAMTGSGKTAAYLLPILERLLYKPTAAAGGASGAAIRVVVLVPTRELATQVHSMAAQLAQFCGDRVRSAFIVGGLSLKAQEGELRARPDLVVATPGRLLDHIRNSPSVTMDDVDVLVLDEADRLLEMGFEDEVTEIVRACPLGRQTMLFSATMTARVTTLAKLSLRKPVQVAVDPLYDSANALVQEFVRIRPGHEGDSEALLLALLDRSFTGGGVLVFTGHKRQAHRLAIILGLAGLSAAELHGNLTQRQRLAALEDFRTGAADVLVATDLAGRGLDIPGVRCVINDAMPRDLTTYVHRVGRTARAGRGGVSVTLVKDVARPLMREVVKRAALNVRARVVPQPVVAAYRARLDAWESDIVAVLAAEREERELRLADMEVAKATNLIEHEDTIAARPKRTWFVSEQEKKELRKATVAASAATAAGTSGSVGVPAGATAGGVKRKRGESAAGGDAAAGGNDDGDDAPSAKKKEHRLTRKKRRKLEFAKSEAAEERRIARLEKEAEAAGGGGDGGGAKVKKAGGDTDLASSAVERELKRAKKTALAVHTATHGQARIARAAKKKARGQAQGLGMSAGQAAHVRSKQEAAVGGGGAKKARVAEPPATERKPVGAFREEQRAAGRGGRGGGAGGRGGGRGRGGFGRGGRGGGRGRG